ncbi:hypothetical protein D3C75_1067620 [compost metagenome]
MGQRQDEVFAVGVDLTEGDFVVVPAPEQRIALEVAQAVVHPAHVPLHREAQAADIDGARYLRPGGGLFGNGQRAGEFAVHHGVQFAQEVDGLEVFPPAMAVGQPLPRLA